ncbi:MAG TPA: HAD family phosphatase [Actinomycetota bacterium]|nr:HAD family phosphatase [Actinomycetota bacterium]
MSRYDALVVDYGGVLTSPVQDAMVGFAAEIGVELQDFVRVALAAYAGGGDDLVVGFETGRVPEEQFARAFARRLSAIAPEPVAPEGLLRRMFARLDPDPAMEAAVRAARAAGLRTALLSNSWGAELYPRDGFGRLFDVVVISGEVGMRKPERAIFLLAAERLGVEPAACVFVDDTPEHLRGAQDVGMTTVLHRTPAQTIAELEALLGVALVPS